VMLLSIMSGVDVVGCAIYSGNQAMRAMMER